MRKLSAAQRREVMSGGLWRIMPKDEADVFTDYLGELFEPHVLEIDLPCASRTDNESQRILAVWDIVAHLHKSKVRFRATVVGDNLKIWRTSRGKRKSVEIPVHLHDEAKRKLAAYISEWLPGGKDGHSEQEPEA